MGGTQSKDDHRVSSTAQTSTSTAAGVMVSGSDAMATCDNLNKSVAGLNSKPDGSTQLPAPTTLSTVTGIHNEGQITQNNHNYTTNIYGGPPQAKAPKIDMDDPKRSSTARTATSTVAGVVVSGSGATATFNNQNQSVAGLNPNPGATPTSSNVAGGIVASHHGQVTIIHNYPGQQSTVNANAETKMLQAINKVMWNKVNTNIEVVKTKSDVNLEDRVYPQFAESDFYKGLPDMDDSQSPHDSRRHEYVKDSMFQMDKQLTERQSHTFKSVMKEFCEPVDQQNHERLAVFGLFAQAGAGKTTCMRHWAKHAMIDNKCSPQHNFHTPHEANRFSLVLYYDLKSCRFKENTALKDFLFEGVVKESEKDDAYDWVSENQSKVIIFFDGLDQATWTIEKKHNINIGPHSQADTPTIMCNLLSRSLLPQSRIILSSREFKAATLPCSARPEKIFIMRGFSPDDAKSVFNSLVSRKFHENPWEEFSKTSPSLQHFLTIPMFLAFSVLVYEACEGSLPNSVTILLAKVLELLQRSSNVQEREDIWQIISKLKSLAHYGMKNKVVVFTKDNLTKHKLAVEEVRDLLFMIPSKNSLNQCLLEGDFLLFFCHQCIQEFLSACFIVELPLSHFKEFVEAYLNKDEWTIVRRFVCGLVFVKVIDKRLVEISDKDKKQDILRHSLAGQLRRAQLELYAAIYESNDESVIQLINDIHIRHQPLSRDGAHLIGSIMARCKKLHLFQMCNCGLDNDLLRIIAKNIGCSKIQVGHVILDSWICSFDFAALNNFLEHVDSDEVRITSPVMPRDRNEDGQPCKFDWKNIRQLRIRTECTTSLGFWGQQLHLMYFRNHNDSIVLSTCKDRRDSQKYFGSYNKKDKTLTVKPKGYLDFVIRDIALAVHWLNRCSVSLDIEEELRMQYLKYRDLSHVEDLDITGNIKIENIVLDYHQYFEEDIMISRRDISSIVKKFQVKVMDLATSLQKIQDITDKLTPLLCFHDFELRIHVVLINTHVQSEDILKHAAIMKGRKIESFRLVILVGGSSPEYLMSWIQNLSEAEVKQFVIVLWDISPIIVDREKLEREARSCGIELTFVHHSDLDDDDPWHLIYSYF